MKDFDQTFEDFKMKKHANFSLYVKAKTVSSVESFLTKMLKATKLCGWPVNASDKWLPRGLSIESCLLAQLLALHHSSPKAVLKVWASSPSVKLKSLSRLIRFLSTSQAPFKSTEKNFHWIYSSKVLFASCKPFSNIELQKNRLVFVQKMEVLSCTVYYTQALTVWSTLFNPFNCFVDRATNIVLWSLDTMRDASCIH